MLWFIVYKIKKKLFYNNLIDCLEKGTSISYRVIVLQKFKDSFFEYRLMIWRSIIWHFIHNLIRSKGNKIPIWVNTFTLFANKYRFIVVFRLLHKHLIFQTQLNVSELYKDNHIFMILAWIQPCTKSSCGIS